MAEGHLLTDQEIEAFLDDLDRNKDGFIDFDEVDRKLVEVHAEIAPTARKHNLHYGGTDNEDRKAFLRSMIGEKGRTPRAEMAARVRAWQIPSMEKMRKDDQDADDYHKRIPLARKLRAYWSVRGPTMVFLALVLGMQIAFGVWMTVKYVTTPKYQAALGWGVVMVSSAADPSTFLPCS